MVMFGMHADLSCLLASHPAFDFHACVCVRRSVFIFKFIKSELKLGLVIGITVVVIIIIMWLVVVFLFKVKNAGVNAL